jgi:hypothetical protein
MLHKNSTDIHLAAVIQGSDPGAVGAGILWIDTSTSAPYQLKKRNAGNSGWDLIGGTLSNPMTSRGDMLYGAAGGASTRLVRDVANRILKLVQNATAISDPNTAPTALAQGVGASTFAVSTTYFVGYSWVNADGETLISPTASFTTPGASPQVETGTIPAAPAGTTAARIYVGLSSGAVTLNLTISSPSTGGTNNFSLSGPSAGGAQSPVIVNTTGGVTPTWVDTSTLTTEIAGSDFKPAGLTGATAASRYVGATSSGSPGSGTFALGDFVVDQSGKIWICTVAGSPGTWTQVSGTGGGGGSSSGGGGSGAMVPLFTIGPLTTAQATIAFASIPQTGFRNLRLVISGRGTVAANNVTIGVQFNGDTGANYDYTTSNFAASSSSGGAQATAATSAQIAWLAAASSSAGISSGADVLIRNYRGTDLHKEFSGVGSLKYSTTPLLGNPMFAGFWRSTAAINSIVLTPSSGNFDVGTYACLYGEMDTAGSLLTPASNLLSETVLSASQPDITISNLPQSYRDLSIQVIARCDNAAVQNLLLRLNGDASTNYDWDQEGSTAGAATAQTGIRVGVVPGTGVTANRAQGGSITIPAYTGTTFQKVVTSQFYRPDNNSAEPGAGLWKNTAAVTSITLVAAAGNLIAGSVVRVYGEPVSAGGNATGTGTRARISATQSITSATATVVNLDVEDEDADNQHFTSAAALTGTVAKTAASQTLVGTGTAFTTELSVGQVISVPGTANEKAVVIAIASATSLTVAKPFVNTASGQTATRVNSAFIFRQPGTYGVTAGAYMAALASGTFTLQIKLNDTTVVGEDVRAAVNATAGYSLAIQRRFQQWDFVEMVVTQTSGGAVNLTNDERTHFEVNARPTVIIAIPYVQVQERQTSGTNGGAFTSGAWRTRVLNTITTDTAGITSLSSNQITLPAGSYRIRATAPAYKVDRHQLRVQNITDSSTILTGQDAGAFAFGNVENAAEVTGRFTITGTKLIELQHQCQTTEATDGFGVACSFGTEVYASVEIWKEG